MRTEGERGGKVCRGEDREREEGRYVGVRTEGERGGKVRRGEDRGGERREGT